MPTAEVLRERRDKAREREEHVEELLRGNKLTLIELGQEVNEERLERNRLLDRRSAIGDALDAEIKADERGRGGKPEKWEEWAVTRRDELADLIEACDGRLERLILRTADSREERRKLARHDLQLERRIKAIEKKLERKSKPDGQLTPGFHIAEFDCRDGTPVPAFMEASLRALCVDHLQPLRDSGGSVHINSGYRHAAYNAAIGGASQSYHIYDLRKTAPAADHIQSGRSATAVQQWHDAHNPPDGMGYYAGFTHIDDRGYRSRWWGAA